MPNRILKDSICTSEEVEVLTEKEEILFYRLIVQCDDHGIFDARPAIIRAKCFPLKVGKIKESDISKWLVGLVKAKLIDIYEVDGKQYLVMLSWRKHQQVRATHSKYPTPDTGDSIGNQMISIDSKCPRESNRIESNHKRESSIHLQADDLHTHGSQENVKLTDDEYNRLKSEFPDLYQDAIEFLSLWITDKGDKSKAKTHNATIRRWVLDAVREKRAKQKPNAREPTNSSSDWGASTQKTPDWLKGSDGK
jgi:hypothetical protein